MEQTKIDVVFRVIGTSIAIDHAYHLFSSLSAKLPWLHQSDTGVFPITGVRVRAAKQIYINEKSVLRMRIPPGRITDVIQLTNSRLTIGRDSVRLGVCNAYPILPSPTLRSGMTYIKLPNQQKTTREAFMASVKRQANTNARWSLGKTRFLTIKGILLVGFELFAEGLNEEAYFCNTMVSVANEQWAADCSNQSSIYH